MRWTRGAAWLLAIACAAQAGCMSYTLRAGDPSTQSDRSYSATVHSIVWGAVHDDIDATGQERCANAGVANVTVTDNFFYTFLNVITLGFWQPMDVSYQCAAISGPIGDDIGARESLRSAALPNELRADGALRTSGTSPSARGSRARDPLPSAGGE